MEASGDIDQSVKRGEKTLMLLESPCDHPGHGHVRMLQPWQKSGEITAWFRVKRRITTSFTRQRLAFLPVLSVRPLTPSFTVAAAPHPGYEVWNQLFVGNLYSQMSDDGSQTIYYLTVANFSSNTVSYTFVEGDL
jgi:hypothetical protein